METLIYVPLVNRDGYFRERLHVRGDRAEPVHAYGHQLLPLQPSGVGHAHARLVGLPF